MTGTIRNLGLLAFLCVFALGALEAAHTLFGAQAVLWLTGTFGMIPGILPPIAIPLLWVLFQFSDEG
jgi:hypothetical protein